jgi:uncharacterized protein (TIGR02466 family)
MSTPKLLDVTPFEPLIIKVNYDGFNFKELEPICNELIKTTPIKVHLEEGDASSSASNPNMPHHMQEFSNFYKWLYPIVMHVLKEEWGGVKQFEYGITNSWVNYHNNGGYTIPHHHGPASLVAATYLNLPENGGFIQFKDPLEYHKGFLTKETDAEAGTWKSVKAKTGDVLLFPGWIRHRTEPNNSNIKRWVLTTNISSMQRPPLEN